MKTEKDILIFFIGLFKKKGAFRPIVFRTLLWDNTSGLEGG